MEQVEKLKDGIQINDKTVILNFIFCADWKMFAQLLGIKAANSTYFCPWCLASKNNREKLDGDCSLYSRSWTDDTVCPNCKDHKKPKICKENHGWDRTTNLLKEPFNASNCLLDSLHGVLRTLLPILLNDNFSNIIAKKKHSEIKSTNFDFKVE